MPELPEKPLNREPESDQLLKSFITPAGDGYDRNHSSHPTIDGSKHIVKIDGAVHRQLDLSIAELRDFEQHTVVCALQCAGNRRHSMRTKLKEVDGIDWFDAAVMNCQWTGPRLSDVLERAGINLTGEEHHNAHVAFACYAAPCENDTWYGGSIPLSRALRQDADVILALDMNDEPLTKAHGYPVRVVTPGIAGARAVKWLDRITVQTRESQNFYQTHDYKILPAEATDAEKAKRFWDVTPAVQEMPVNSVIIEPKDESTLQRSDDGTITIQGYALPSGDDGPVVKVEISVDGGSSWTDAELLHHPREGKWSWMLWKARLHMPAGSDQTVMSRATDAAGNTQPEQPEWNLRGVCYNGYGEVNGLTIK